MTIKLVSEEIFPKMSFFSQNGHLKISFFKKLKNIILLYGFIRMWEALIHFNLISEARDIKC